jgi:tetratricopeptide (TPR) repeat protein
MLESKNMKKIALGILFIVLGFLGWYIYTNSSSVPDVVVTDSAVDIEVSIKEEGVVVEETQAKIDFSLPTITAPNLDRAVAFPDRFNQEAQTILNNNIKTLVSQLKEDSNAVFAWFDLANQYKIIDDFEGAVEIWEYLRVVTPENTLSYLNLGNVYHYHLKEYEKSENAYRDAIAINNQTEGAYTGLHDLYKYSYKQGSALAEGVLLEGVSAIEDSIALLTTLAAYYKEVGNSINAKKYYEQVRDRAQELGNTELVDTLNEEISNL